MKVFVVVPAFNEKKTVRAVLTDLRSAGLRNVVVVDDGSVDRTGFLAKREGVVVLTHALNRGLGAALGSGFAYARKRDADVVVTFDADGQHKARDVGKLVKPIEANKADVVIGSRMKALKQKMPLDRRLLNYLANLLTYLFYGVWTSDSQSGLRAFGRRAVENIRIKTDRMEVSSEFFREIKRNRLRFLEVPIEAVYTKYSRGKEQSNLNAFAVGFKMVLRLFR